MGGRKPPAWRSWHGAMGLHIVYSEEQDIPGDCKPKPRQAARAHVPEQCT